MQFSSFTISFICARTSCFGKRKISRGNWTQSKQFSVNEKLVEAIKGKLSFVYKRKKKLLHRSVRLLSEYQPRISTSVLKHICKKCFSKHVGASKASLLEASFQKLAQLLWRLSLAVCICVCAHMHVCICVCTASSLMCDLCMNIHRQLTTASEAGA